jgi:hypothetical protein
LRAAERARKTGRGDRGTACGDEAKARRRHGATPVVAASTCAAGPGETRRASIRGEPGRSRERTKIRDLAAPE